MQLNGNLSARRAAARGFTLIEVLITLVIVSVGLLGLAKLEAAAMAETQVSRVRALMTMQAESIASMLRSNRTYWGASGVTLTSSITAMGKGNAPMKVLGTLVAPAAGNCLTACKPEELAYDDFITSFGSTFNDQFAGSNAKVACAGTVTTPTTCDITLTWQERGAVAINRTATDTTAAAVKQLSLVLHVQP